MRYLFLALFICLSTVNTAFAQNAVDTLFEKGPNKTIRFFYDYDYYLVDKNCEFKTIERVAEFDIPTNKFNGQFRDFASNGRTVLSGNYVKGSKEGDFFAYYPDGKLKWQATFVNDQPQGLIKYFYPDGKPMLELINDNTKIYIKQYWDKKGNQDIKDGEGEIDITLPIIGFTEHGFSKYKTVGNVSNGLQNGIWNTFFIAEDKKNRDIRVMTSTYNDGELRAREINDFFTDMLIDFNSFSFSPLEAFHNAELLQSKNCTFDEHTGFNSFIAKKFTRFLVDNSEYLDVEGTITLEYTVRVGKSGSVLISTLKESSRELTRKERFIFERMINNITYYLPSYLNNKAINDRLTISLQLYTKGEKIMIPPVQIVREKGI